MIWRAELDPGILSVSAVPIASGDPDQIDPGKLRPFLTLALDRDGHEHVVLSDGWHRIRLDIDRGSFAADSPITLNYHIAGVASAAPKTLPLRRFLELCRRGRFAASLFPSERGTERWILLLRVHDAVRSGASQREIAETLLGGDWGDAARRGREDSLRSRVRRLIRDARRMAGGGYRELLHERVRVGDAKVRATPQKPHRPV